MFRSETGHRPDMIGLPAAWWYGKIRSRVAPEVHAGQLPPDHLAVNATVKAILSGSRATRPLFEHAELIVSYLQCRLQQHFPLQGPCARKRHSFLSEQTWSLHGTVSRLRGMCGQCKFHIGRHLLAAAFRAWKGKSGSDTFLLLFHTPWLRQTRTALARFLRQLDVMGAQLRSACAADRAAYLTVCASKVNRGLEQEGAQAVRRLLGHKRKRPFAPDVLPMLLDRQGVMCTSPDQIAASLKPELMPAPLASLRPGPRHN